MQRVMELVQQEQPVFDTGPFLGQPPEAQFALSISKGKNGEDQKLGPVLKRASIKENRKSIFHFENGSTELSEILYLVT
jgi:hypothetical protein